MNETPIQRIDLADAVLKHILERIRNGEFQPGAKLPSIQELSERLQVGRSSIREALKQLQIVGFIEVKQGKGTFVREKFDIGSISESISLFLTLHKPDILHLIEARKIIENGTVALAAQKASKDEIEKLHHLLQKMEKEIDNPHSYARYSVQFHITIAEASKNPLLPIFFNPIHDLLLSEQQAVASLLGIVEISFKHHTRIWKAIKKHNADEAVKEMNSHLEFTEKTILKAL